MTFSPSQTLSHLSSINPSMSRRRITTRRHWIRRANVYRWLDLKLFQDSSASESIKQSKLGQIKGQGSWGQIITRWSDRAVLRGSAGEVLTDERLRVHQVSCGRWEAGHYLGKAKFINRERFQNTPLPQLTETKSFLHLLHQVKGESDRRGVPGCANPCCCVT